MVPKLSEFYGRLKEGNGSISGNTQPREKKQEGAVKRAYVKMTQNMYQGTLFIVETRTNSHRLPSITGAIIIIITHVTAGYSNLRKTVNA